MYCERAHPAIITQSFKQKYIYSKRKLVLLPRGILFHQYYSMAVIGEHISFNIFFFTKLAFYRANKLLKLSNRINIMLRFPFNRKTFFLAKIKIKNPFMYVLILIDFFVSFHQKFRECLYDGNIFMVCFIDWFNSSFFFWNIFWINWILW